MSLRDKGNAEKPSCYEKTEGIPALRVHLENGEIYVLPYIHFQFAQLSIAKSEQSLIIQFSSHIVTVHGHGLKLLQHALHKLELALVQSSTKRVDTERSLPLIREIEIQNADVSSAGSTESIPD